MTPSTSYAPPIAHQPLGRTASAMSSRSMPIPPGMAGSSIGRSQTLAAVSPGGMNGSPSGSSSMGASSSGPPPPPLKPRPPLDYIKETQDEDARVGRIAVSDLIPNINGYDLHSYSPASNGFSPHSAGSGSTNGKIPDSGPPPPPLPPKVRLDN